MTEQMQAWINMVDSLCEQWGLPRDLAVETAVELFEHNLRTAMEHRDSEQKRELSFYISRMLDQEV